MGRRSRKRGGMTTRAERDAARAERQAAGHERPAARRPTSERPKAAWGSFPLSELVILLGIIVMIWGFLSGRDRGDERVAAGLLIASLGGGELALREHLAGYRSHSALLAGVAAFAVVTAVALTLGPVKVWVLLIAGAAVFVGAFYAMRELFKRRSGGLGFR
jgi:hypothetical protein